MSTFEADSGYAIPDGEALGVGLPFLLDEVSGGVDHLLHAEIGDRRGAQRSVALDRTEEPEAGVSDPDEIAARPEEAKSRQGAEITRRRGEFEPADEFERTEHRLVAADVEFGDRPGRYLDLLDGRAFGNGRSRQRRRQGKCCHRRQCQLPQPGDRKDHPARRKPPRRVSRALTSSNSEASCSVIAPASSSASTMVTARR